MFVFVAQGRITAEKNTHIILTIKQIKKSIRFYKNPKKNSLLRRLYISAERVIHTIVLNNQSISLIFANHYEEINFYRKTIYNYIKIRI